MTTIAILGHQEHGKTSVAQAITGMGAAFQITDGTIAPDAAAVVVVVSGPDGAMPGTRTAVEQSKPVKKLVMFINKFDMIGNGDEELIDLVEMELRELVQKYRGDGDTITVIRGSAKDALDGKPAGHGKQARTDGIRELVTALY